MTVELFATSEALSYAQTKKLNNVVVITNSKSALQHIARCASGFRGAPVAYAVLRKIHEYAYNNLNVVLQWVPSHIGLQGNEEADRLAKRASTEGIEIFIKPTFSELITKFKKENFNEWIDTFKDVKK